MQKKTGKRAPIELPEPEASRVAAINRMLNLARVIRRSGTDEEAEEASRVVNILLARLAEIENVPEAA